MDYKQKSISKKSVGSVRQEFATALALTIIQQELGLDFYLGRPETVISTITNSVGISDLSECPLLVQIAQN
jgi:hypothetical protein